MDAAGIVPRLKDGAGFWLPNTFVDRHARAVGPRATFVYCFLLRQATARHYPGVRDLAAASGLPPARVHASLCSLLEAGLLNQADLDGVFAAGGLPEEDPAG